MATRASRPVLAKTIPMRTTKTTVYVIVALHRWIHHEPTKGRLTEIEKSLITSRDWRLCEVYGLVKAASPLKAFEHFAQEHRHEVEASERWSYDGRGQRVWAVLPVSTLNDSFYANSEQVFGHDVYVPSDRLHSSRTVKVNLIKRY